MKALAILATVAASVTGLGAFACVLGGIWTDREGRVDSISVHLFSTGAVLVILFVAALGAASMLWPEVFDGDNR